VKGLSENISVVSIVDRFLEHARVLYFYHGGEGELFISSADWMPRSLDRRIELLTPIVDTACKHRLMEILDTYFRDNQNAWGLQSDSRYQRLEPIEGQPKVRAQKLLYQSAIDAVKMSEQAARTRFEPHRPAQQ